MEKNYWYRSNNLKKYLLAFALLIVGLGIDESYASDVVYYEDYDLDIIFEENDKESTEDFEEDPEKNDSLEEVEDKNDKLNEEISNIIKEEMDKLTLITEILVTLFLQPQLSRSLLLSVPMKILKEEF